MDWIMLETLESVFVNENFINSLNQIIVEIKDNAKIIADNEKTIETSFDSRLYALFKEFFS